jgi:hypothetical protein
MTFVGIKNTMTNQILNEVPLVQQFQKNPCKQITTGLLGNESGK